MVTNTQIYGYAKEAHKSTKWSKVEYQLLVWCPGSRNVITHVTMDKCPDYESVNILGYLKISLF